MKIKNKGKVYPSPSLSSYSSSNKDDSNIVSVLKLLPATILTLASVLSSQDREVLAYMITRSLKQTSLFQDSKKKPSSSSSSSSSSSLKHLTSNKYNSTTHKISPLFDCDCFDCYTSYWFRWDSSSNRELIHQVIEAFEEHLSNGELSKKGAAASSATTHQRGKRRDKTAGRRVSVSVASAAAAAADVISGRQEMQDPVAAADSIDDAAAAAAVSPNDDFSPADGVAVKGSGDLVAVDDKVEETEEMTVVLRSPPASAVNNHKGLARKVLPDVLGLFNSRLWHLWSPNV